MPEKEEKKEQTTEKPKVEPAKKLHVVSNVTAVEICIRVGTDSTNFVHHFVPPHGQIEVSNKEARKIYKRIKQTKTLGIGVSGYLKPLGKIKKQPSEEASVEIN